MKLTFKDKALFKRMIEHTLKAADRRPTYAQKEDGVKIPPGLWLVGDQGIYLMSNGDPGMLDPTYNGKGTKFEVLYADQCNPNIHEDWWERKSDIFGGDDGCEFIPLPKDAAKRPPSRVTIKLTPKTMDISWLYAHAN